MNRTVKLTDCQDALTFIPVNSLACSNRRILFFSRVSKYGQDHRKYIAALQAAHNRLNLPMPFTPNVTFHKRTECGQLGTNTKYFTWFAKIIRNMEGVVCVFPALDRLFRPIGYDQYQESDFELFRQKLAGLGLNPENITFALLNDGALESDRAFETRLGENYLQNQGQIQRIDPETSNRLRKEVLELRTLGMTPPDIYFYLSVRLERIADRTVRKWYKDMGFPSGIAIIYCLFFHIVLPYCIYFFQNASQCPVVKTNVRNESTTLDPFSLQRAPDTHSLCLTTTLHAASVTPLPIGRFGIHT